jgi:hypothetical protein
MSDELTVNQEPRQHYVTQEAKQLLKADTLTTYKVKGLLHNIHGDWAKKEVKLNGNVWHVIDHETGNEEQLKGKQASTFDSAKKTETKKTREIMKECHCFPRRNNHALIPLGGPRGYINGMFRAIARTLSWNQKGSECFGALSFIDNGGITISPDWFEATEGSEVKMHPFFVKEAKGEVFFEYIEKTPFEISVSVVKNKLPNDMTLKLIAGLERIAIGPKRRGTLEIQSIAELT